MSATIPEQYAPPEGSEADELLDDAGVEVRDDPSEPDVSEPVRDALEDRGPIVRTPESKEPITSLPVNDPVPIEDGGGVGTGGADDPLALDEPNPGGEPSDGGSGPPGAATGARNIVEGVTRVATNPGGTLASIVTGGSGGGAEQGATGIRQIIESVAVADPEGTTSIVAGALNFATNPGASAGQAVLGEGPLWDVAEGGESLRDNAGDIATGEPAEDPVIDPDVFDSPASTDPGDVPGVPDFDPQFPEFPEFPEFPDLSGITSTVRLAIFAVLAVALAWIVANLAGLLE